VAEFAFDPYPPAVRLDDFLQMAKPSPVPLRMGFAAAIADRSRIVAQFRSIDADAGVFDANDDFPLHRSAETSMAPPFR
jgi:hypothetical protein